MCEVLHSTADRSFSFQDEGRQIEPHHVQETCKNRLIVLVESLFQNYQFCLIKYTLECKTKNVI